MSETEFNRLTNVSYISLTTFRRTGKAVSTPVWVVPFDGGIGVITAENTGKIKRLRHTSRVLIAESNQRGGLLSEPISGSATICDSEQVDLLSKEISKKYGWQARLISLLEALARFVRRGAREESVGIIIRPE